MCVCVCVSHVRSHGTGMRNLKFMKFQSIDDRSGDNGMSVSGLVESGKFYDLGLHIIDKG